MCENMAICVNIWLSFDICVKYAQCVKIWLFDVLFLFPKCAQFLKPCVQFLMDTILNLATCSVSGEEKGRHALITCVSLLKKMEMHFYYTCFLSHKKGDARYGGTSPIYLTT
jgi:hypothetical protein